MCQQLLANEYYPNVKVWYIGNKPRNYANRYNQWEKIKVEGNYTTRDIQMLEDSDKLIALWDNKSKGTKRNIDEFKKGEVDQDGSGGAESSSMVPSSGGGTDAIGAPGKENEGREPKALRAPPRVSQAEIDMHEITHTPYRSWCEVCVKARGRNYPHKRMEDKETMTKTDRQADR